MSDHDLYTGKILEEIGAGNATTQRALSRKLGIALGLTNLLVRRLVRKGLVKVTHVKANRVTYLITPTGMVEKVRLTRAYFENTIHLYTETRSRIQDRLERVSAGWAVDPVGPSSEKRVVFYGAGEVAEIGYISLQSTDLRLVGVVDDERAGAFFGVPVRRPEQLRPGYLSGEPFEYLIVMTFRKAPSVLERLKNLNFPLNRVLWLEADEPEIEVQASLATEREPPLLFRSS